MRLRDDGHRGSWGGPGEAWREAIQVECDGFRCLAYLDSAGLWRHYYSGDPLIVLAVVEDENTI